MALDIDGFDVLRRIGGKRKLFAGVEAEAKEFARKLATKQIEKIESLKDLKAICKGLGKDTFVLLSDGLSDAVVLRIVRLSDPYQSDSDHASPALLRRHLVALSSNAAKPSPKPKPPKKPKASTRKKVSRKASTQSTKKTITRGGKKVSIKGSKKALRKERPAPAAEPEGFFWGTAMSAIRRR